MKLKMDTTDLDVIAKISAHLKVELCAISSSAVNWSLPDGELNLRVKEKERNQKKILKMNSTR